MTQIQVRAPAEDRTAQVAAPAPGFFADTEVIGREDWLRLHLNENPYGPPPGTVEAVHTEAQRHLSLYPDSECAALRARLAVHFRVEPEQVAVGNGTDELVLLTSMTFLRAPGATVAVTTSTFPGYITSAAAVGAGTRNIPLRDGAVPADELARSMREGAALAFVCNPVNPTGSVLDEAALRELVDAADETGAVLVVDEAYMDFAGPAHEFAMDAVRQGRRLLVLRTFSKAWGLASLRLGCALGPADLVQRITSTSSALPFNVSRPAQQGVLRALEEPGYVERVREDTAVARAMLCEAFDTLGLPYLPSVANFVMVAVPGSSVDFAAGLARDHQILVRNLDALGLPGHLRISVGTVPQVERLIAALTAMMDRD